MSNNLKRRQESDPQDQPAAKRAKLEGKTKTECKAERQVKKLAKREKRRAEIKAKVRAMTPEEIDGGCKRPSLFEALDPVLESKLEALCSEHGAKIEQTKQDLEDECMKSGDDEAEFEEGIQDEIECSRGDRDEALVKAAVKHKKPTCHVCSSKLRIPKWVDIDGYYASDEENDNASWKDVLPTYVRLECKNGRVCEVPSVEFGARHQNQV